MLLQLRFVPEFAFSGTAHKYALLYIHVKGFRKILNDFTLIIIVNHILCAPSRYTLG